MQNVFCPQRGRHLSLSCCIKVSPGINLFPTIASTTVRLNEVSVLAM